MNDEDDLELVDPVPEAEAFDLEVPEKTEDLLLQEKQKTEALEEKLKHTLADFQNLERRTISTIKNHTNEKFAKFILDFLQIYDDFLRARAAATDKTIIDGFDTMVKNMDSLFSKYGVTPIDSLGEIFDPNFHEAISIIQDDTLDENTITKEIRKGYISQNMVIRHTLVEISKKLKTTINEMNEDE